MNWAAKGKEIGQATFTATIPMGGFVESWAHEASKVVPRLQQYKEGGCDHIAIAFDTTNPDFDAIIQALKDLEMTAIVESNDPNGVVEGYQAAIDKWGDDWIAALVCFDDQGGVPHGQCKARYEELQARFPQLAVYASGAYTTEHPDKNGLDDPMPSRRECDIMAQQFYPISNEGLEIIRSSNYYYPEAHTPGKPLMSNIQSWPWHWAGARVPTAEEMRAMAYIALMYCKGGITWYSFYQHDHKTKEITWDLLAHPELWEVVKEVNKFAKDHQELLLDGMKSLVATDEQNECTWTKDGKAVRVTVKSVTEPTYDSDIIIS